MTTESDLPDYLTTVIAGTLMGQLISQRDIDFDCMSPQDRQTLITDIAHELAGTGIDPRQIAYASLCALMELFGRRQNADTITESVASLLWTSLGDPSSGQPPEIYHRAARAVHCFGLGLLDVTNISSDL